MLTRSWPGDEELAQRLMREHVDMLAGASADAFLALETESGE